MNTQDAMEALRERFEFEAWAGRTTLEGHVFFVNELLLGLELPGWEREPGPRTVASDDVRFRTWFWRGGEEEEEIRVRVDVAEHPSLGAAHRGLLELLGQFQSPRLRRLEEAPADVAFDVGRPTAMMGARGNVVTRILNAGGRVVELSETFRALDDHLVARPAEGKRDVPGPRFERLGTRPERPDREQPARLILEAVDPLGGEVALKIFSPGEVSRRDGELVYRRSAAGVDTLHVYARTEAGGLAAETLEIGGPA